MSSATHMEKINELINKGKEYQEKREKLAKDKGSTDPADECTFKP